MCGAPTGQAPDRPGLDRVVVIGHPERVAAVCAITPVPLADPVLTSAHRYSAIVDAIPGARLVSAPGPGRSPQVEDPTALAVVVNAFLDEISDDDRSRRRRSASAP